MNIDELLEKIEDATGMICDVENDLDGQVILLTGLRENDDGELVELGE